MKANAPEKIWVHEASAPSIWHDSNKEQPEYGSDVIVLQGYNGDVLHRVTYVNPNRIWAYLDDLLNLSNERTIKNWEEPVSEELNNAAVEWFNSVKYKSDLSGTPIESFKAGAKWQLERVKEALLSEALPCFMHGGETDEVVAKLDEVLNQKK